METVTVKIYGESYTLRAGSDPDDAREAARYVDDKMREIASGGRVIATSKIAILAALNIADELLQMTREKSADEKAIERRLEKLLSDLSKALEK